MYTDMQIILCHLHAQRRHLSRIEWKLPLVSRDSRAPETATAQNDTGGGLQDDSLHALKIQSMGAWPQAAAVVELCTSEWSSQHLLQLCNYGIYTKSRAVRPFRRPCLELGSSYSYFRASFDDWEWDQFRDRQVQETRLRGRLHDFHMLSVAGLVWQQGAVLRSSPEV